MCPQAALAIAEKRDRAVQFVGKKIPLYYQLASLLHEKIVTGRHAPGDRFPTEAELVEEYGLSRITVRQALRSLEEQGLVRRKPGRGTFVAEQLPYAERPVLCCSLEELMSTCLSVSSFLLEVSKVVAAPEDALCLKVEPQTPLVQVSSAHCYRGEPCSFVVHRIPAEVGGRLSAGYLKRHSMLELLEKRLGIPLVDAELRVRATLADVNVAHRLKTYVGAPLLLAECVLRSKDDLAVMRTIGYYRADICLLRARLVRDARARKAVSARWVYKVCKDLSA